MHCIKYHFVLQGGAQPSTSSPAALTGEASSGSWGPQAGAGELHGEAGTTTGYGPPLLDNPSETLEEARRLLASSLQAEPSTSSGFPGPMLLLPAFALGLLLCLRLWSNHTFLMVQRILCTQI